MLHDMPEDDILALWQAAGSGLVRAMTSAVQDARTSAVASAAVAAYTRAALVVWRATADRNSSDASLAVAAPSPGGLPAAAAQRQAAADAALDWLKAVAGLADAELPHLAGAALSALLPVFVSHDAGPTPPLTPLVRLREELGKRLLPRVHSITRRMGHLHSSAARDGWKLVTALLMYVLGSVPGAEVRTSLRFVHLGDARGDVPAAHVVSAWLLQCTQVACHPMSHSGTKWCAAESAVQLLLRFGGCSQRQVAVDTAAQSAGQQRPPPPSGSTPPPSVRLALRSGVDGCCSARSAAYVVWPLPPPSTSKWGGTPLPQLSRCRCGAADALLGALAPILLGASGPCNRSTLSRWRLVLQLCAWCSPALVLQWGGGLLRGMARIQQPGDRQPLLQRMGLVWAHVLVWERVHAEAMRGRDPPYSRSKGGGLLAPGFDSLLSSATQVLHAASGSHTTAGDEAGAAPSLSPPAQLQALWPVATALAAGTAPELEAMTGGMLEALRRPGAVGGAADKPARRFVGEATLALLGGLRALCPAVPGGHGGGAPCLGDARAAAAAAGIRSAPLVPLHAGTAAGSGGAPASPPPAPGEEDVFGLGSLTSAQSTQAGPGDGAADPFAAPAVTPPLRGARARGGGCAALGTRVAPAQAWALETASVLRCSMWAVQLASAAAAAASDSAAREGVTAASGAGSLGGWLSSIMAGGKAAQLLSPHVVHPGEDTGASAGGARHGTVPSGSSSSGDRRSHGRRSTLFGSGTAEVDTSNDLPPVGQPPYTSLLGQWLDTLGMTLLTARGVLQTAGALATHALAARRAAVGAMRGAVLALQPGSPLRAQLQQLCSALDKGAVGGQGGGMHAVLAQLGKGPGAPPPAHMSAEDWVALQAALASASAACSAAGLGAAHLPWLGLAEAAAGEAAAAAAPPLDGTAPPRVLSLALTAAAKWLSSTTGGVGLLCVGAVLPPPVAGAPPVLRKAAWGATLGTSAMLAAAYAAPQGGLDTRTVVWSSDSVAPLDSLVQGGGAALVHSREVLRPPAQGGGAPPTQRMGGVNAEAIAWLKGEQNVLESALARAGISEGPLLAQLRGATLDAVSLWECLAQLEACPAPDAFAPLLAVGQWKGAAGGSLLLQGSLLLGPAAGPGDEPLPLPSCPTPRHTGVLWSALGALQQLYDVFGVSLSHASAGLGADLGGGLLRVPEQGPATPGRPALHASRLHKPHGQVFGRRHGAHSKRPSVQEAALPPRPVPGVPALCALLLATAQCDPLLAGPAVVRGLGPITALLDGSHVRRAPSLVNVDTPPYAAQLCACLLACTHAVLRGAMAAQGRSQLASAVAAVKALCSASVPARVADAYSALLASSADSLCTPPGHTTTPPPPEFILLDAQHVKDAALCDAAALHGTIALSGACDAFGVRGQLQLLGGRHPLQLVQWAQAALAKYSGQCENCDALPGGWEAAQRRRQPLQLALTLRNMMPSTAAGLQVTLGLGGGLHAAETVDALRGAAPGIAPLNPLPLGSSAAGAALLGWSAPGVTLSSAASAAAHRSPMYAAQGALYGWSSNDGAPGAACSVAATESVGRAVPPAGQVQLLFALEVDDYRSCSVSAHIALSNVDASGDSRLTHVSLQQRSGSDDADSIASNDPAVEGAYGRGGWASTMHVQGGHTAGDSSGASWLESVVSAPGGDEGGLPALLGSDSLTVAGGVRWAPAQQEAGSSYSVSDVLAPPAAGCGEGDRWAIAAHGAAAYGQLAALAADAAAAGVGSGGHLTLVGPHHAVQVSSMHAPSLRLRSTTLPPSTADGAAGGSSTPRTPLVASRRRSFFARGSAAPEGAGGSSSAASQSPAQAWAPLHAAALEALRGLLQLCSTSNAVSSRSGGGRSTGGATPPPITVGGGGNAFHTAWSVLAGALGVARPPPGGAGLMWVGPSLVKGGVALAGFGLTDSATAQKAMAGRLSPKAGGGFFRSADARQSGWCIARGVALGRGEAWFPHAIASAGGGLLSVDTPPPPLAGGVFLAYTRGGGLPRGVSFAQQQVTGIVTGQLPAARGGVHSTGGRRMTSTGSGGMTATGGRRGSQMTGGSGSVRRSVGGHSAGGGSVAASGSVGGSSSRDAASEVALLGATAAGAGAVVRRLVQRGAACPVPLQCLVVGAAPPCVPGQTAAESFDALWRGVVGGGLAHSQSGLVAGPAGWAAMQPACRVRSVCLGGGRTPLAALAAMLPLLCGEGGAHRITAALGGAQQAAVHAGDATECMPGAAGGAAHGNLRCAFVGPAGLAGQAAQRHACCPGAAWGPPPPNPIRGLLAADAPTGLRASRLRAGCTGVGCNGEPLLALVQVQQQTKECSVFLQIASPSDSLSAALLQIVLSATGAIAQ